MILRILLLLYFCFSFSPASALVSFNNTSNPIQTEKLGLFSTIDSIRNQKVQITELMGALSLEELNLKKITDSSQDFQVKYETLQNIESEILSSALYLSGSINADNEALFLQNLEALSLDLSIPIEQLPQSFSDYQLQADFIEEQYLRVSQENFTKTEKSQQSIIEYASKLEIANSTLLRQEKLLSELYKTLGRSVGVLIAIVVSIFLISQLIQWAINARPHLIEEKKNVLMNVVKWTSNISIIVIIAVFFFSELLSFLPFLAILGTAIGFALRDIISSFIAWFLIGHKDSVYKIGDVIEVEGDNVFGRVFKISPVVTTIQELGLSGPSGMYKSFPNKAVFEKSIKNISKINNWIYITVDFLLDKKSSIPKAKTLLLEVMNEVINHEKYSSPFEARAPFRKYGITEANMHPQIFLDIKPQGIFLRGKIFVYWAERHDIRSEIVEMFFNNAQKDDSIEVKQVEIG